MFPIKDYNPTVNRIVVVPALIALNVIMFLFIQPTFAGQAGQDREEKQAEFFVCRAAIADEVTHQRPLSEASPETLDDRGRLFSAFQQQSCPHKSVLLSILLSMFLHGGLLHIAGNMLFLWVFGNNVEDRLGAVKFIVFYLLCGLLATVGQTYLTPDSVTPLIGASGAIAGVLGAYIVMFPRAVVRNLVFFFFITVIDLPAIVVLGLWFVLQVFQGVGSASGDVGGVAYMAHVAGFVAGMALLFVFRPRRPERALPYEPF